MDFAGRLEPNPGAGVMVVPPKHWWGMLPMHPSLGCDTVWAKNQLVRAGYGIGGGFPVAY